MLDQRRASEKGFITLKEAAKLTNYSPDYVGQLIRSGKIRGEQVYASTVWVTTPEEVLAYMQNKKRTVRTSSSFFKKKFLTGIFSSYSFAIFVVLAVIVLMVFQYILYVLIDHNLHNKYLAQVSSVAKIDPTVQTFSQ